MLFLLMLAVAPIGLPAGEPPAASDFAIVTFLSKHDAVPGEEVEVTVEVYSRKDVDVLVPDPEDLDLSYEQVASTGDMIIYTTSTGYRRPDLKAVLHPRQKLNGSFLFTVPDFSGVLSVMVQGFECVPAAIRIHGSDEGRAPLMDHRRPSLKEIGDAIKVLPKSFRKKAQPVDTGNAGEASLPTAESGARRS